MPKSNQTPTLYLFVGYPGAGKTTVAQAIRDATGAEHIWADKERRGMFGDTYSTDQSVDLYELLNTTTEKLLKQGKSVIFDTNFNYKKDRQLLHDIAAKHDATTKLIWLTTSKALSKKRAVGSRQFVNMTASDFDTAAAKLEPPSAAEHPIKIDGTDISTDVIRKQIRML
jgi:predicted kinase